MRGHACKAHEFEGQKPHAAALRANVDAQAFELGQVSDDCCAFAAKNPDGLVRNTSKRAKLRLLLGADQAIMRQCQICFAISDELQVIQGALGLDDLQGDALFGQGGLVIGGHFMKIASLRSCSDA